METKDIAPRYWRKIINNDDLWEQGIMQVISKEGKTLKLVCEDFHNRQRAPYDSLSSSLQVRLAEHFPDLRVGLL